MIDEERYEDSVDEGYEFAKKEVEAGRQTLEEIESTITDEEMESAQAFNNGIREYLAAVECGDESGEPESD